MSEGQWITAACWHNCANRFRWMPWQRWPFSARPASIGNLCDPNAHEGQCFCKIETIGISSSDLGCKWTPLTPVAKMTFIY